MEFYCQRQSSPLNHQLNQASFFIRRSPSIIQINVLRHVPVTAWLLLMSNSKRERKTRWWWQWWWWWYGWGDRGSSQVFSTWFIRGCSLREHQLPKGSSSCASCRRQTRQAEPQEHICRRCSHPLTLHWPKQVSNAKPTKWGRKVHNSFLL